MRLIDADALANKLIEQFSRKRDMQSEVILNTMLWKLNQAPTAEGEHVVRCKDDRDCVFCEQCTDVWWDYTNLIYMIACADDHDPWERPCKYFKEGGEQ